MENIKRLQIHFHVSRETDGEIDEHYPGNFQQFTDDAFANFREHPVFILQKRNQIKKDRVSKHYNVEDEANFLWVKNHAKVTGSTIQNIMERMTIDFLNKLKTNGKEK